ncbi:type II toxin-antitoxin system VapB family antitoxin [Pseudoduganella sp. LjRoot289]|uniref:type II toxin-antitoxin system VapB family antitoxin n=1 Tax=Pseudoduganella sp. LjRoot289 TaxID=3342314 RepID=UPI003F4F4CA6
MKAFVEIDEKLLAEAFHFAGPMDLNALIHTALTALVQREAARQLALRGGSEPFLDDIPRRRSKRA